MNFDSIPSKINTAVTITPPAQSAGSGNYGQPSLPLNRDNVYITAILKSTNLVAGEHGSLTSVGPVTFPSPIKCTGVHGATIGTLAYYIQ